MSRIPAVRASSSRTLVVTSKPNQTRDVMPHITAVMPGRSFDVLALMKTGPLAYRLPRGAAWSDYPLTGDLAYKPDPNIHRVTIPDWSPLQEWPSRNFLPLDASPENLAATLSGYDEIVYAGEYWYTDFGAFAALMRACGQTGPWRWLRFRSPTEADLRHAAETMMASPSDGGGPTLLTLEHVAVRYADTRRYFDFNWLVNATAVFGETVRRAGGREGLITKYVTMLLHVLAQHPDGLSQWTVLELMKKWKGTGRYTVPTMYGVDESGRTVGGYPEFGTCASRAALIRRLIDMGLAENRDREEGNGCIVVVSETGRRMLDLMHPTTYDPDLPFRLHEWGCEGLDTAKPKIDRYVRTLFGRQKRYLETRS